MRLIQSPTGLWQWRLVPPNADVKSLVGGVEMVLASVVLNITWAIGELVGAPTAAGVSTLTSDTVALMLVAAVMLATLVVVLRTGLIRGASRSIPPDDYVADSCHDNAGSSDHMSIAGG